MVPERRVGASESRARVWRSTYRELPIAALSIGGPWQYGSRAAQRRRLAGRVCAQRLILLHHPEPAGSDWPAQSSAGIVKRIANERTGALHEHRKADALYRALKRALRSAEAEPV